MHEWLTFSAILLGIWFILYIAKPILRKEMFWVSLFTMPFGLTEPLFVPEYWSPPSLFNLAARTGFDIESLIFCFAVGGIGAVLYEAVFKVSHQKVSKEEIHGKRHRVHKLALSSPVIVFLPLYFLTSLNPIYSASIAMFIGGIAAILCRPDLKKKIWIGGLSFLILYFVFFLFFNLAYPGLVQEVWNLSAISGILILGVPLEELMFAFTFGMLWSSVYEHASWYKLKNI
ncbi:MAG: lycopene cyclase domain-containing protein [Candidatus Woesearchaeota archaeon]